MKRIELFTDAELAAVILAGEDHPRYDEAADEEGLRASCAADSRIAQGMGRAVGIDNEPS